jgi:hypothetical protein
MFVCVCERERENSERLSLLTFQWRIVVASELSEVLDTGKNREVKKKKNTTTTTTDRYYFQDLELHIFSLSLSAFLGFEVIELGKKSFPVNYFLS